MPSQRPPHDAFFKEVFSQPEAARGEIEAMLPLALVAELLASKVGAEAGETVMTTAEQLREQGIERGLEQGIEQGRRDVLLRQIHFRFGALAEEYVRRVKSADSKRLDALTERVLTATSVGDLFR